MRASLKDLPDGRIAAWVPFEFKDEVKLIPGRRWHPDLRCWSVPEMFRLEAQILIDWVNYQQQTTTPGDRASRDLEDKVTTLFVTLPVRLRKPTHRSLAKAWHPDADGDEATMRALNRAASKAVSA